MSEGDKIAIKGSATTLEYAGDKYIRVQDVLLFLYKSKSTYNHTHFDDLIRDFERLQNEN